jgi:hypothetical protein
MLSLLRALSQRSIALALLTSLGATQQSEHPAQRQAETELLSLHKEERRAHFEHDAKFLLAHVAPELLDVRDGQVNRMSPEAVRVKFLEYFKHSQFSAWDDVDPPIIRVSPDGKMAWMIVRVHIAYTETDTSGKKTNQSTVGAWMSAYEKQKDDTWLMTAVTSTFSDK